MASERMRLTEALYRGEDSKGQPFSLRAGSAVQKSSAEPVLKMTDLQGRIIMNDGPASLTAGRGLYESKAEKNARKGVGNELEARNAKPQQVAVAAKNK